MSVFSESADCGGQPWNGSLPQPAFLPMTREEMLALGWDSLDILLVSGDAYVDHPSFGTALLGRWLTAHGFRVGIAAQPPWQDPQKGIDALRAFGPPRLFAGATAGAIDSMLAHYTAFRKKRRDDAYTPGGLSGARPNRACIVYTGMLRRAFPGIPVILGGIEASLRRISHYDFWTDSLRKPLLLDSKADLLLYGMGERALLDVARKAAALHRQKGEVSRRDMVAACRDVSGLVWAAGQEEAKSFEEQARNGNRPIRMLPSHETVVEHPAELMRATLALEQHVHNGTETLVQQADSRLVAVNPPAPLLSPEELDRLYDLPYSRLPHPLYTAPVPAWEMIRTSITTHRGCGGGCSFCSLALHQGRRIASRSRESVLREASRIAAGPLPGTPGIAAATANPGGSSKNTDSLLKQPDPKKPAQPASSRRPPRWAGSISDVGGPSANMWQARCALGEGVCRRASCLHPAVCKHFLVDQSQGANLLRQIQKVPGVRHVRVASGVRFDLALQDEDAMLAYAGEFAGGQCKVAPEHIVAHVLHLMRKPGLEVFERFLQRFYGHARTAGKEQYTVPYLMSAFPGCTKKDMEILARWLASKHWQPQQVQCFIPTPGTVATAMYFAGITPDGRPCYVPKTDKDRLEQHRLLSPAPSSPPPGQLRSKKQRANAPQGKKSLRR